MASWGVHGLTLQPSTPAKCSRGVGKPNICLVGSQEEEEQSVANIGSEPKRVRQLRRKPAEPGFRQLSAAQLSGSVGHALAQMRQAFAADDDELGNVPLATRSLHDSVTQRLRAAEEPAPEPAPSHSDAESGELVASPPRGEVEGVPEGAVSKEEAGSVEGGEQMPVTEEFAHPDPETEEVPERRSKDAKGEKRRKERSDRGTSRGKERKERKESRRQDREQEGGHKHKKRRRRSESRSLSPSDCRRRRERSEGRGASSGSVAEEHGSKWSQPEADNGQGARPLVAGPPVSDALRARVRAMLESVALK